MEIHALKVRITEQDLANLSRRALRDQDQLSDVQIRIADGGIVIAGNLRLIMRVAFETRWSITIKSGKLALTLSELRAGGVPAGMLKGVLMSMIQSEVESQAGMAVDDETIVVDPDRVLAGRGLLVRTNLVGVECASGSLTLISQCEAAESKAA